MARVAFQPPLTLALCLALALGTSGCPASPVQPTQTQTQAQTQTQSAVPSLRGRVGFGPARGVLATMTEVASGATVSLIAADTGQTVATTLTDAAGVFDLGFAGATGFSPTAGKAYMLEAVKGLSAGGAPNRAGPPAARVRTLVYWNAGWQSLSNTDTTVAVDVTAATTALAAVVSHKQQANVVLDLNTLIGTVSGTTFKDAGTGLSATNDFAPALSLVSDALALDRDPLASIRYDAGSGSYSNPTPVTLGAVSPAVPAPGDTVTISGSGFDAPNGLNALWLGNVQIPSWTVSADRTAITATIPASALSGPFVLHQTHGAISTIHPFLKLKGVVATFSGSGTLGYLDGRASEARYNSLHGIGVDAAGNVYLADAANHRIRKVNPAGMVTTLAGSTQGHADGTGAAAKFNTPTGGAIDSAGNVYVADYYNHRIRKITPAGEVSTIAGSGTMGGANGTGIAAQFNEPRDLTLDGFGNIYIAEDAGHRIRKLAPDGVVTTLAGSGGAGFLDDAGTTARFNRPLGVATDAAGNVYVADLMNNRIRKVTPAGIVTTLAGGAGGFLDGNGTTARFNLPHSIASGPDGNFYVADYGNHRIRKVTPAAEVTLVAGTGTAGFADGPVATAQLKNPATLRLDAQGNVYIFDRDYARIRVVTP